MEKTINKYIPLLDRIKSSKIINSLTFDHDFFVPSPPFHLIPEELKLNNFGSKVPNPTINSDSINTNFNNELFLHRPRNLAGCFSYSLPEVRKDYKYLISSKNALNDLNLNLDYELNKDENTFFKEIVSGQKVFFKHSDSKTNSNENFPYSLNYAGYQFGTFAGQLGDGRVVNLFDLNNGKNDYILQLKGSGKTPFSRFADGKAVLRSSIREFFISEYLNAIGIPSTRALSLTYLPKTYAQRIGAEKCAVVTRFAESWLRVGNFDLLNWRSDRKGLLNLSNFIIENHFPYLVDGEKESKSNFNKEYLDKYSIKIKDVSKYDEMYLEIVKRNAKTTALSQVYGYLNGVLNTDNTSILGLAMDFGPFAMMDKFNPDFSPNHDDVNLRYGYNETPSTIWWNLTKLGEDLIDLIGFDREMVISQEFVDKIEEKIDFNEEKHLNIIKRASKVINICEEEYQDCFMETYTQAFRDRLGLLKAMEEDEKKVISPMLTMLLKTELNYNRFFYNLSYLNFFSNNNDGENKFNELAKSLLPNGFEHSKDMSKEGIIKLISEWLKVFYERLKLENSIDGDRLRASQKYNPAFVPSNWIFEEVISKCKEDNCEGESLEWLEKFSLMCCNPFSRRDSRTDQWGNGFKELEDRWCWDQERNIDYSKLQLQCSCSS
ncbi:Fmp40p [Ascoidea rubescens DSM 1968]|uniref:Selenoprotein O n=1 Tax=Ascoidea rubescens DSM 1968 TaxID=1344418 RepID=A0A1D2VKD5_9ASCO|nr:UPF0061-domain-containing protein [Ascoidea rubescens DSM 1968]ODV62070.1 UPF0061-domain-containing protein [Ascoidea rubescens DSM 1968]